VARYRIPLILLGLFVVLLLVVLLTQNNSTSDTQTAASATATPDPKAEQLQILKIATADAPTKIEVKQTDPAKAIVFKYENAKWLLDGSTPTELDTVQVSNLVGQFNSLRGTALITDKGDNLANYGLDKPALVIGLNSPTQGVKAINVGQQNPATKVYYVKLENDPRVWTVAPVLIEQVKGWLTTPPVQPPTPTALPSIGLSPLPTLPPVTPGTPGAAPPPAATTAPATTAVATTVPATTAAPAPSSTP